MKNILWSYEFKVLSLIGQGVRKFLHGQTSVDILSVKKEIPIKACWLSTSGKVLSILEIVFNDQGADICVLSGELKDLFEGFNKVIFPFDDVEIDCYKKIIRVQEITNKTSWKKSKVQWIYPNQSFPEELKNHSLATPDQVLNWRISQGLFLSKDEINDELNPFELGLYDLVNTNKGCYLGQEAVSRFRRFGVSKCLRYWESDEILNVGDRLIVNSNNKQNQVHANAGFVTSAIQLGKYSNIGFAIIKNKYLDQINLYREKDLLILKIERPIGFIGIPEIKSD